ncbi:hypothetical protein HMPREF9440_01266 [Sutterella parvirubra YIT 11816]|uniref:Uncharacterized protein n=1 Tax=Sutterella parvirubra YIT 11816 TaxID=762967 RepID=H3KEV1_9BURK|nr:hypothetical protein HMPREF9440_01266 [Sutterella parvirubra YIT 11816]
MISSRIPNTYSNGLISGFPFSRRGASSKPLPVTSADDQRSC